MARCACSSANCKCPGGTLDTRGRVNTSRVWPDGGMVSRPMADHHYDVNQFGTGFTASTVEGSGWTRGKLLRSGTMALRPAKPPIMYDPTDPNTWPHPRF